MTYNSEIGPRLTPRRRIEDFFPYTDPTPAVQTARKTDRWSFALDYKLDISNKTLRVGNTEINLEVPEKALHLSEPISVIARTGDQDGINPPWFWRADSILLFWWIHRENAVIPVRVKWTANYAVELWPDSQEWLSGSSGLQPRPEDLQPLLTIKNLYAEDPELFWAFAPKAPVSSSPSRTYPIRVALLSIIAPTGLLFYSIFSAVGSFFSANIFWLIVVAVPVIFWYVRRKPRLSEMRMSESMRNIRYGDAESLEPAAEAEGGAFRWSWNWFVTTRSPLDDVLRSFETTRHLTRPLSLRRPSMDGSVTADDSAFSDVDSERTLAADEENSEKGEESCATFDLEKGKP